jgi:hypothetical protein
MYIYIYIYFLWRFGPTRVMASSFLRFLSSTQRRNRVRTPLDEWSARRRDLYLTTHNTHNRQTPMPSVVFKPAIPTSKRPLGLAKVIYICVYIYIYIYIYRNTSNMKVNSRVRPEYSSVTKITTRWCLLICSYFETTASSLRNKYDNCS